MQAGYSPRWLLVGVILSICISCGSGSDVGTVPAVADVAPKRSFSLIDQHGRRVAESDFSGEWLLVFFGFTHCPDVCPVTLARVKASLDLLGSEASQVRVLFITVDPERDTADVLDRYLESFGPEFVGLTGTSAEIETVKSTFGGYAAHQASTDSGEYQVDHSATLYLVDPEGRLSRQFSSQTDPSQLAESLRGIISGHLD